MAKSTYNNKKTPTRKYKRRTKKVDFKVGIFFIVIGVILSISLFSTENSGAVGEWTRNFITGTFGILSYLLPVIMFIVALWILAQKSINKKYMWYFVNLFLCFSTIIYLFSDYIIYNHDYTFGENLGLIYGYNETLMGGVIGGIIGIPLVNVFGYIITMVLAVIWLFASVSLLSSSATDKLIDLTSSFSKWIVEKFARKRNIKDNLFIQEEINNDILKDFSQSNESDIIINDNKVKDIEFPSFVNANSKKLKENIDVGEKEGSAKQEVDKDEPIEKLDLEHTEVKVIQANYELPDINLLSSPTNKKIVDGKGLKDTALKLEKTLMSFGVEAKILNVSKGPTITRYELSPAVGVKVSKIMGLADDIALNLAVSSIRIAPIEGKSAIGIEVPNKENDSVTIKEIIASQQFKNSKADLSFAVGKNIAGDIVIGDIAKMPHLLIAGATGSGKSVCINTIITSILYKSRPDQVKFIMIDPKVVELGVYNGIPHLLIPVVTDPRKAAGALQWAVQEMVNRYNLFAEKGVRDIKGYNELLKSEESDATLPQVVIIIDELSDLMMVAPNDVEDAICRLAQMARAAGMYLVVATQRPSVDVVTGLIKANIPSRISFAVSSQIDSRTILDMAGAEKLLGKGDMLYYPTGSSKPIRLQGPYVSEKEIEKVVDFIKQESEGDQYNSDILEKIESGTSMPTKEGGSDVDPLLTPVIEMIVESGQASASIIQRRFKVGYNRAARMIDDIQARGLIGGPEGSKPRKVLISKEEWENMKEQGEI